MKTIYITGHKNPDLDSICSAYAYAVLKNKIDPDNNYKAVRCGHIGQAAKQIFANMGITPPPYMKDVYPKVGDVMLTSDIDLDVNMPLSVLASSYNTNNPSATPVFDNGVYSGLLTVDDIAAWTMNHLRTGVSEPPLIKDVMRESADPVQINTPFSEVKYHLYEKSFKTRGIAVFNGSEYAGYVTRRCFLEAPKYNVIMVDHNEPDQSIRGIKDANIIEIIDHHRLNPVTTDLPIFIDSEPVGSTCTIVYKQYRQNGLLPDTLTAKVLLTGLVADTLILKSPTTTKTDIDVAGKLAGICGVDVEEFGKDMFSNMSRLKDRDPKEAILSDFKRYTERGMNIGVAQCEATSINGLSEFKDKYIEALELIRKEMGLDWAVVMITDVIKEHSVLLTTDHPAVKHLSYVTIDKNTLDMPGVMSRKKQLLPDIIHAISIGS